MAKSKKLTLSMWKDKYGNVILIKNMSDYHLLCAIRCKERYAKDRERNLRSRLQAVINDINASHRLQAIAEEKLTTLDVEGFSISKEFPRYSKLCEEALRRGLLL